MEIAHSPSEEVLKDVIMNVSEPLLFQGVLQDTKGASTWKLLEWNLSELAEKFGDIKLPFRVGYNARSLDLQWDVNCATVSMTLSEFLKTVESSTDEKQWYYFDYKYMQEWFKEISEVFTSVNWSRFGFNKTGADSTIWIGNKGAHTNCHQDSYGCNLIAQIHGRKRWLLFPPSSTNLLEPTRIPYEESTVYSKFNFFCPSKEDERSILKIADKPKSIILEPGDVLLVPAGWWHYVESLDLSISVNVWLPVVTDSEARVKEAIVKLIVARIGKKANIASNEPHCSFSYCMKLLEAALEECANKEYTASPCKKTKRDTGATDDLVKQYPAFVKQLEELSAAELEEFLKLQRERFSLNITDIQSSSVPSDGQNAVAVADRLSQDVVNALCHPDVVNKVAELLITS